MVFHNILTNSDFLENNCKIGFGFGTGVDNMFKDKEKVYYGKCHNDQMILDNILKLLYIYLYYSLLN